MPTYQYACTNEACGLHFERVQAFTDAAITECPDCAGQVRKVYGSVGVVFKGSGFYRNDSREANRAAAKSNSESSSSSLLGLIGADPDRRTRDQSVPGGDRLEVGRSDRSESRSPAVPKAKAAQRRPS